MEAPGLSDKEKNVKVLVTGAAGFLGSHIVDRSLALGHETHVIVRKTSRSRYLENLAPRIHKHIGDLTNPEAVEKACRGMDLIIHSAGRVTDFGAYEDFYRDNVLATETLLKAARKTGVKKFVFISSPSIFSADEDHVNVDESIPYPNVYMNFYAKTKSLAEQLVLSSNSPELFTCSLRPRGIWGERDYNGFFPKLLKALKLGKLKDFSQGKKVEASLCHAANIAEACFQAADHSSTTAGEAYFITDDKNVYVWDLIETVGRRLNLPKLGPKVNDKVLQAAVHAIEALWKLPILYKRRSPPISRYSLGMLQNHTTYSVAKAKRDFGYSPKISMAHNLEDFLRWIEEDGGLDSYLGLNSGSSRD